MLLAARASKEKLGCHSDVVADDDAAIEVQQHLVQLGVGEASERS